VRYVALLCNGDDNDDLSLCSVKDT